MNSIRRHAEEAVNVALTDTPIVVIQGPRQAGKSTLMQTVLSSTNHRYVTFDDPDTQAAARYDLATFIDQLPEGCLAIDEVQLVPELILPLKASVDRNRRPGRFLLSGSADLLRLPAARDSLAGRAESIMLYGFSQGELSGHREAFIDRLLAADIPLQQGTLNRTDYMQIICTGAYPEAIARTDERRRRVWFDNYLSRIVQRDAADISDLFRLAELPKLLRLLAAQSASEVKRSTLARDSGISESTLPPYVDLLETMYITHHFPAWSNNLAKRVARTPKTALLDSGLAARLVNASPEALATDVNPDPGGFLMETFVMGELRKQLPLSEAHPDLFHYRELDGAAEVDVVIESPDGRIAAVEVKSAASIGAKDFRGLARLQNKLGDRFTAGVVLYTGTQALPFGPNLAALPLSALWTM